MYCTVILYLMIGKSLTNHNCQIYVEILIPDKFCESSINLPSFVTMVMVVVVVVVTILC